MERRFRSKVDMTLVVTASIGVALPGIVGISRLIAARSDVASSLGLVGISLALASVFLVSYTITDDALVVRRGPIRSRMPLSRLRELRSTREAMAAPALSLDRIEIRTDKGLWLLVSPSDKIGFIRAIQDRVPSIRVTGLNTSAQTGRNVTRPSADG